MVEAPNQTPIEPGTDAIEAAKTCLFDSGTFPWTSDVSEALAAAYAIDLAPIIAERDRMKAALETILDRACDSSINHYMADFIYEIARAALESKP